MTDCLKCPFDPYCRRSADRDPLDTLRACVIEAAREHVEARRAHGRRGRERDWLARVEAHERFSASTVALDVAVDALDAAEAREGER
jgi:hypothetical protein